MENINKKKIYKPDEIRNPYFVVPFLIFLIGISLYFLFHFLQVPTENLLKILFFLFSIIVCGYLILTHFINCAYVEIKENSMVCKNYFKMMKGEIYFEEIVEMIAPSKLWYDVRIKDIHGKTVLLNAILEPVSELFNEIINRSINCKKIDLRNIKKVVPDLVTYEKGL